MSPNRYRVRRRPVVAILPLLAIILASCTPALQAPVPPVDLPERFSAAGQSSLPDRWWTALDDPVLDELVERTLAGNLDLRTAWDRLRQAGAIARRTGAGLSPTLDAEASGSRRWNETDDGSAATNNFSLGPVLAYEADLWGRIRSQRDAALFSARASREDLQTAALTLSAEVASTWYQLVEQYGQLDLLQEQLATNEQVLELVTLRFRRGQVGAADVLQQRQLVEANHGQRAQSEAQAAVLEHRLAILLGIPPGPAVAPRTAVLQNLPPLPATGLPAELVRRRPDLQRAFYRVAAADRTVAAAVADRFPRLGLSARLETGGPQTADLFQNWLGTLAANLAGPLVDGGRRRAEVERTRAAAAEELHAYGQAVLEAFGEVEDALVQEERQREFLVRLDRQLEMAKAVTERVRQRYLRGSENYLRVLDALQSEQGLQRNRLSARRQLLQYRLDLHRALGGGWELEPPSLENVKSVPAPDAGRNG